MPQDAVIRKYTARGTSILMRNGQYRVSPALPASPGDHARQGTCSGGGSTRRARGMRRGLVTDLVTPLPSGYDRSAATLMWSVCFPEGKKRNVHVHPAAAGG